MPMVLLDEAARDTRLNAPVEAALKFQRSFARDAQGRPEWREGEYTDTSSVRVFPL